MVAPEKLPITYRKHMTHTPLQIGPNHDSQASRSDGNQTGDRDTKTGRFLPGNKASLGREDGSMNFKTQWRRVIQKIAQKNRLTEDEVDDQMLTMVFQQIQAGHFGFYKDTIDRIYSPVPSKVEMSGQVDSTITNGDIVNEVTKKLSAEYLDKFKDALKEAHKPKTQ